MTPREEVVQESGPSKQLRDKVLDIVRDNKDIDLDSIVTHMKKEVGLSRVSLDRLVDDILRWWEESGEIVQMVDKRTRTSVYRVNESSDSKNSDIEESGVNEDITTTPPKGRFTKDMIDALRVAYEKINTVNPSSKEYKKLSELLDSLDKDQLFQLAFANIKFISKLASVRINRMKEESEVTEAVNIGTNAYQIQRSGSNWEVWRLSYSQGSVRFADGRKGTKLRSDFKSYEDALAYAKKDAGVKEEADVDVLDEKNWGGGFETSREAQAKVQAGLKADAKKRQSLILSALQQVNKGKMSKPAFKKLIGSSFEDIMSMPFYSRRVKTKKEEVVEDGEIEEAKDNGLRTDLHHPKGKAVVTKDGKLVKVYRTERDARKHAMTGKPVKEDVDVVESWWDSSTLNKKDAEVTESLSFRLPNEARARTSAEILRRDEVGEVTVKGDTITIEVPCPTNQVNEANVLHSRILEHMRTMGGRFLNGTNGPMSKRIFQSIKEESHLPTPAKLNTSVLRNLNDVASRILSGELGSIEEEIELE